MFEKRRMRVCAWIVTIAGALACTGNAVASATDPGTLNIETKNITNTTNEYAYTVQWRSTADAGDPTIVADDDGYDEMLQKLAAALSWTDAGGLQGQFFIQGSPEFGPTAAVTLAGFATYVDVLLGQDSDTNTSVVADGVDGVDYLSGDSDNPSDWLAINDVTVKVTNTTTITNHYGRALTAFVTPVAAPPAVDPDLPVIDPESPADVPEPPAAWLIIGALGLLALRARAARATGA